MMRERLQNCWPSLIVFLVTTAWLFWLGFVYPPALKGNYDPYEQQAHSWLAGRWDLMAAYGESFEHAGKFYTYFGPFPSVLRVSLFLIAGRTVVGGGLFLFAASMLNFVAALLVFRSLASTLRVSAERWLHALFGLAAGLGSSLSIIAARPSVYHEAIAFGSGFILLATWAFLEYVRQPSLQWIVALNGLGLIAIMSRQTWLIAALLLTAAACWKATRTGTVPLWHVGAFTVGMAVLVGSSYGVAYLKYGELRLSPPLAKHSAFRQNPARLERVGNSMFHLSNLRTGAVNYLALDNIDVQEEFPFIIEVTRFHLYPESRLDGESLFVSLPWSMGLHLALSALAFALAVRHSRTYVLIPISALAFGALPLFLMIGLCGRYLHDFYPALVFGAAAGMLQINWIRFKRVLLPLIIVLLLVGMSVNTALAIRYQETFGTPSRRAVFDKFRMDPTVHLGQSHNTWLPNRPLTIQYSFGQTTPGSNYPLLTIGKTGFANFIWFRFDEAGNVSYCFNSWGSSAVPCSRKFEIHPGDTHKAEVTFKPDSERVILRHDDMLALDTDAAQRPKQPAWVGVNSIGGGLTVERTPAKFDLLLDNIVKASVDYSMSAVVHVHVSLQFEPAPAGFNEPVVTTGQPGTGNFIWLRHLPDGRVTYLANSWGSSVVPESLPLRMTPRKKYDLQIEFRSEHPFIVVKQDGVEVLEQMTAAHRVDSSNVRLGENRIGGGLTEQFAASKVIFASKNHP